MALSLASRLDVHRLERQAPALRHRVARIQREVEQDIENL